MQSVAILPEPGDNCAVACQVLEAGTRVELSDGSAATLTHRTLEGHRFVVETVKAGDPLLSWGTRFATAIRTLDRGAHVYTERTLDSLRLRGVPGLPDRPNAADVPLDPYTLDECALVSGEQVNRDADEPQRTFLGYHRTDGKVGTRNHIVVLGVTSRTAGFAEAVASRFADRLGETFDGVVAVAHTEAGELSTPNNLGFVLGVLAGCVSHPNVGAVLIVDETSAKITGTDVLAHHTASGRPPIAALHQVFTRSRSFASDRDAAVAIIEEWIDPVSRSSRTEAPLSALSIALQCGGSDAFSGITANPLAGLVAAETIRHGGTAVLAETDELIGAEHYILSYVRSADVARAFLGKVQEFKQRLALHGHTAEGNPSAGNIYRGLTNIVLKSLGAARKLPREVRLDHVCGYAEPCPGTGYVFMDSPGNDLESVAGQVATGCNLIFFTTGNGSITNFPFVPTLKFVSTSARHVLLAQEMDINAGAFLDGESMPSLTARTFELALRVADGERTAGERAGHSQVSIWRDWKQTESRPGISISVDGRQGHTAPNAPDEERDADLPGLPLPAGSPTVLPPPPISVRLYTVARGRNAAATERVALVLPTSLCSGQVSRLIAEQAEAESWAGEGIARVVSLPHTEGCGASNGANISTFARLMTGCLTHPNVAMALLLEHGCEKTTHDFFRSELARIGVGVDRFGWASIQLDGGVTAVTAKARRWFHDAAPIIAATREGRDPASQPWHGIAVGLEACGDLTAATAQAIAAFAVRIIADGGSILLPSNGELAKNEVFRMAAFGSAEQLPTTLAHGQRPAVPGWHVMRAPTTDWTETASGLVAAGCQVILAHVTGSALPGQRLAPVLQVSAAPVTIAHISNDLDAELLGDREANAGTLLSVVAATLSGEHRPRTIVSENVGFQITRGLLGTST
ncbi:UxaA family hydrolase [Nocardia africana]|uniref:UxaA family hydrolase n=1 Tax=Nocardia africana TaxID=134964 RepID=A0ABW6NU66_9NOCA